MPRPLLRKVTQTTSDTLLSTTNISQPKQKQKQDNVTINYLLRKKRSQAYIKALKELDAGGHTHNQAQVQAIIEAITNEFPEIELSGIFLGLISKCYLGKPYEVHTLDFTANIIEHYKAGSPLPQGMEKARSLAIRGGYEFIEVYTDCCRAISADGSVAVIPN